MFRTTHKDREGNVCLIAEMTDSHLLNTIQHWLTVGETFYHNFVDAIESGGDESPRAKALAKIYGRDEQTLNQAIADYSKAVAELSQQLEPYLSELWVRTLSEKHLIVQADLKRRWQIVCGRNGKLQARSNVSTRQLPAPNIIDADEIPF